MATCLLYYGYYMAAVAVYTALHKVGGKFHATTSSYLLLWCHASKPPEAQPTVRSDRRKPIFAPLYLTE